MPGAVADRAFLQPAVRRASVRPHAARQRAVAGGMTRRRCAGVSRDASIRPSEATLIAVGDCDHDDIVPAGGRRVRRLGGRGRRGSVRADAAAAAGAAERRAAAGRAAVGAAHRTCRGRANTPDYHALVAANMVLGGQFVSRINLNLREDKGLHLRRAHGVRLPPAARARSRCRSACRPTATGARDRGIARRDRRAFADPRPVTPEELALGDRGADARLRAQLRDRRAGRPRGHAARARTICPTTTSRSSCRRSSGSRSTT